MTSIFKLLVANRGEIACRVIASARAAGYHTVAIFSDADADALHVRLADEAVRIGPGPSAQSYLDMERVIEAARRTGADAVHPGYGFLSERAAFAEACQAEGLCFVGPDPESIRIMGDKAESKRRMIAAGVPCVPGYQGDDQSEVTLCAAADDIGFPVMVKASAGGGGRGMRLVQSAEGLPAALRAARSEAEAAFGDGRLLLERAVIEPRHVEIQVMGDRFGHVIHLGERDCSVQRRHQKVIEEAPSPVVDAALRAKMGEAAVMAAKSIDYVGAGTVEFLLAPDGRFYFLEMNTRLQVEHPVTEMVTGLDLVALQLRIAEGHPIGLAQGDIALNGHAIEARLYAESPEEGFLPQTGMIAAWQPPVGDGIRVDHGLREGASVSAFYDPMLAKIIAWGCDRGEACRRLGRAIADTQIFGVATNRAFLAAAVSNPEFVAGQATTGFIPRQFPDGFVRAPAPRWAAPLAVALLAGHEGDGWRSNCWSAYPVRLSTDGTDTAWTAAPTGEGWRVRGGDVDLVLSIVERHPRRVHFEIDGVRRTVGYHRAGDVLELDLGGTIHRFCDMTRVPPDHAGEAEAGGVIRAPMTGIVTAVDVATGDRVARGQLLMVLEAMKMEHPILAPIDGVADLVAVTSGLQVAARDTLAVIRADSAE